MLTVNIKISMVIQSENLGSLEIFQLFTLKCLRCEVFTSIRFMLLLNVTNQSYLYLLVHDLVELGF